MNKTTSTCVNCGVDNLAVNLNSKTTSPVFGKCKKCKAVYCRTCAPGVVVFERNCSDCEFNESLDKKVLGLFEEEDHIQYDSDLCVCCRSSSAVRHGHCDFCFDHEF